VLRAALGRLFNWKTYTFNAKIYYFMIHNEPASKEPIFLNQSLNTIQSKPHSAYIFGATTRLGDALINQLLSQKHYQNIYICTHTALPSTTVDLKSFLITESLNWDRSTEYIDCFLIVQPSPNMDQLSRSGVPAYQQHDFYAPLYDKNIPDILNQLFKTTALTGNSTVKTRWLIIAPTANVSTLKYWLIKYANDIPILTYSDDHQIDITKEEYRFQTQGSSFLDRLGVMLLNTISSSAHLMINGRQKFVLTPKKLVQHLLEQLHTLTVHTDRSNSLTAITHLTRKDIPSALK
jgi:hypothetical protein